MKMKKRIWTVLFALILCMLSMVSAFAQDNMPRVVDNANLLTDSEKNSLKSKLDEISNRQKADIVVLTVDSLDGKEAEEYADDFYDQNDYGFGKNKDGVLLLVSMENRDWWMSTTGYGITAITDAGREYISDKFVSYLGDGYYEKAFTTYADLCDTFFTQAKTGEPYDKGNLPKEPFDFIRNLLIALAVGVVVAFIITNVMKAKLKTVRLQSAAGNYVKENSMQINQSREFFLYSHVDRQEKPKDTGGGSSTHTSSSGETHGGGGGKF